MITYQLKTFGSSHQEDERLSKDCLTICMWKIFDQVGRGTLPPVRGLGSVGQVFLGMNEKQNSKEERGASKYWVPMLLSNTALYIHYATLILKNICDHLVQVSPQIDSETELCVQEVYRAVLVELTPVGDEGCRTEQREKLNSFRSYGQLSVGACPGWPLQSSGPLKLHGGPKRANIRGCPADSKWLLGYPAPCPASRGRLRAAASLGFLMAGHAAPYSHSCRQSTVDSPPLA